MQRVTHECWPAKDSLMQTVEFEYPHPPRHIEWVQSGAGMVEVSLWLTCRRSDDTEPWQIVGAAVCGFAPYVMGSKHGMRVSVDHDTPDAWLDWCRTQEFLSLHGADIEQAADEQWLRDSEGE